MRVPVKPRARRAEQVNSLKRASLKRAAETLDDLLRLRALVGVALSERALAGDLPEGLELLDGLVLPRGRRLRVGGAEEEVCLLVVVALTARLLGGLVLVDGEIGRAH